jgi:plastocyanin
MTFVPRAWRLALVLAVLALLSAVAVPALAKGVDVSIVGTSFQPATITVEAGDAVTWTTTQSIGQQHSVTSGKPGAADQGKAFDSGLGLQDNGQTFAFTFTTPGTYDYFCQVHPTQMIGQVIVTAAGGSAPPASAPAASAPAGSAGPEASPGGSPAATEAPVAPEAGEPVPPQSKVIAAAVLGIGLVLLFAANWYWRKLNPP